MNRLNCFEMSTSFYSILNGRQNLIGTALNVNISHVMVIHCHLSIRFSSWTLGLTAVILAASVILISLAL